jgi:hypothetical protein
MKFKERDVQTFIDVLTPRTAYEIDALRLHFQNRCGGDLAVMMSNIVGQRDTALKFVLIGLVLGPALFDLWLLHRVSPFAY